MTKRLFVAVLFILSLEVLVAGYGAVAAEQEGQTRCAQSNGIVQSHECIKGGQVLFSVPR